MNKELSVRLNGTEIGLLKLVNGKMEFTYSVSTKFPISLSLPVQQEPFKEKICRSFFGGLLPENENMRKLLAQKYNININDDFKLLKEIGRDCAGALSFYLPNETSNKHLVSELKGEVIKENDLKKMIEELPYKPYMGKRISLAGAQEKTAVCIIDGVIMLPIDDAPTTHILKTALPKYSQSIENEYICMTAAKQVGINVANVEIKSVEDVKILLIERFDRIEVLDLRKNSNKKLIQRILQEDFAQSLGVQSKDKYNVTFKDCLKVLEQTTTPAVSKQEFIKRVVYNYIIGNTDAHSKNFSVFIDEFSGINLTPAYDLLCTSIYDCDQQIAMKIGKAKYYKDVTEADWKKFADDIDVSYKVIQSELVRQKKLLPEIFQSISKGTDCETAKKIESYVKTNCNN